MSHFDKKHIVHRILHRTLLGILLLALITAAAGCATIGRKWKELVGGKSDDGGSSQAQGPAPVSYSSNPDVMTGKVRLYHRVTAENFDDDQGLDDNAGSLWRRQGQGSYLFSQNSLRNIGDIINVQMEGRAAESLNVKLSIVKAAQIRTEAPIIIKRTVAAGGIPKPEEKAPPAVAGQGANQNQNPNSQEANANNEEKSKEANMEHFEDVPCRIVQRNDDGTYRVKGASSVYVGRHEYKLIVTGIVRPEDVTYEDSISSTRVLDSKFDLVATNKELRK